MKKKIVSLIMLATILVTNCVFATAAIQEKTVNIEIEGESIDGPNTKLSLAGAIQDGRTLAPIRDVVEAFGATVFWYGDSQEIQIYRDVPVYDSFSLDSQQVDTTTYGVLLKIGSNTMYYREGSTIEGEVVLDVPPQLINGRTMLPVRAVCEYLNTKVGWVSEEQTVVIMPIRHEAVIPNYPGEYSSGNINRYLANQ